jgi:hypothetical protein
VYQLSTPERGTASILKLLLPPDTPRLANIALRGDVLVFAVVVSLVTGILAGLAPAWKAAGLDLESSLRLNETNVFGSAGRFRTSRLLVIGQIALAVVVITAAGVMLRSLSRLSSVDPGFRTASIISAQISLDRDAYRACSVTAASMRPAMPESMAMRPLSVSTCWSRRPALAPSARRKAISRWRVAARASIRLATFAQAMSNTRATVPTINKSLGRILPTTESSNEPTVTSAAQLSGMRQGKSVSIWR